MNNELNSSVAMTLMHLAAQLSRDTGRPMLETLAEVTKAYTDTVAALEA